MSIWNKYFDWPPVWLLIFMAIAWVQVQVWNPLAYQSGLTTLVGRGAIAFGIILMGVSFIMFLQHKTSVVPKQTPRSMITAGPYKYSRNPIYVADAIVLIGYVLTLGSVISFVLVPAFAWVIRTRFINGEEVGIRVEFGQAYEDYCQQTRRWL
jgi:protein-S-isoprenylcysteine O-methyltransferase Ste14